MNYYIYGLTSKGNVRDNNEDRILVYNDVVSSGSCSTKLSAPFIAAVCDGVGGENAGEVAAELCLKQLSELNYRSNVDLKRAVLDIHHDIKRKGIGESLSSNMQTTLCALAVDESGEAVCVNVGDSRMYRFVNAAIRQISTDQSYRQFVYEHGGEGDVARIDPKLRNAIVSSVGSTTNEPEIELIQLVTKFGKEPDDTILIVSDGISDYVTEQQLEIGMGLDLPLSQKLEAIAQLALDNGSADNLSIVGIKPYITKQELEMITAERVAKTVNIQDLIKETDKLGDILTLDLNEIISQPYVKIEPDPLPERPLRRERKAEEAVEVIDPQHRATVLEAVEEIEEQSAQLTAHAQEAAADEAGEPEKDYEAVVQPEVIQMQQEVNESEYANEEEEQAQPSLLEAIEKAKAAKEAKLAEQTTEQEQQDTAVETAEQEQQVPVEEEIEKVDLYELGEQAVMAVETNADSAAQTIREIEEAENAPAQELMDSTDINKEFLSRVSNLTLGEQWEGNSEVSQEADEQGSGGKTDLGLNAVELLHQSASSLAKLEKLFGNK